ncbi:MAG: tRNA (adenosine(37)-N6)-threonylcarbamoyltransferase complex dimerization subunit type 1 TsaB [Bacteroidia bacterium]|nr:tRNA (adenosine(37)-N6)-threonylcarbamoyltransferase complex dimerization subunit type 1 TsaB [Bacteroidia bacterium]MDW8134839.1 tRNA (adenosine(37)-N6)-threonylcarbamoyltransferase complex dimerization subunit type 1 TsaB [Bacteroidia bacterium]
MKGWGIVIETASPSCQVGLLKEGEPVGGIRWDWPQTHGEELVLLTQQVLRQAGLRWNDIIYAVYHQGPGSHTGLRIGLTAIKAWALSFGWKVYAVPLLHILRKVAEEISSPQQLIFCAWQTRGERWYGQMWKGDTPIAPPELLLASEWKAKVPEEAFWVGNIPHVSGGVYLSEISWQAVAAAARHIPPLDTTEQILALMPLYFRPFFPTQRKKEPIA